MYGIVRLVMRIRIGVIESGIRVKILIFCQFRTGIQKGLSGKGGRKSGSEFFCVSGLGRPKLLFVCNNFSQCGGSRTIKCGSGSNFTNFVNHTKKILRTHFSL